mmetsp:Transcript_12236/g.25857  ORF Transcript_12236/g.25857 Transcript_12236/m.25857 type:complete len:87 (-) Transcript_12236:331-591(-)
MQAAWHQHQVTTCAWQNQLHDFLRPLCGPRNVFDTEDVAIMCIGDVVAEVPCMLVRRRGVAAADDKLPVPDYACGAFLQDVVFSTE